jgi:NTE family protein
MEQYPLTPFIDKKSHEITCIKIKSNNIFQENIDNPKQFVESFILSTLSNRYTYDKPIKIIEVNVENTNVFDFNMSYEEKVKLYNMGFLN